MKKLFPLLLIILNWVVCKGQVTFQKTYGDSLFDIGNTVYQTTDGGFIIGGSSVSFNYNNNEDVYLLKTNYKGDILWTKVYGTAGDDELVSLQKTLDSGYILLAYTNVTSSGGMYLIKTDITGDTLWTKVFNRYGGYDYIPSEIQETKDSCYVICGGFYNANMNTFDYYLTKINAQGNLVWNKIFHGMNGFCYSIKQTNDNGYVLVGGIADSLWTQQNFLLIKTDVNGNIQWSKAYENTGRYGLCIQQTLDGGYIITGEGIGLIKTDSLGDVTWSKYFTGPYFENEAYRVIQTFDSGYVITISIAYEISPGPAARNVGLIKTDSNGDTTWTKTYGGSGYDISFSVESTNDMGFIITGGTTSFGTNGCDAYLIKTDSMGNSGCNETNLPISFFTTSIQTTNASLINISDSTLTYNTLTTVRSGGVENRLCSNVGTNEIIQEGIFSIFPNPLTSSSTLQLNTSVKNAEVVIYDIVGKEMMRKKMEGARMVIERGELESGVYVVRVSADERQYMQKIVVE